MVRSDKTRKAWTGLLDRPLAQGTSPPCPKSSTIILRPPSAVWMASSQWLWNHNSIHVWPHQTRKRIEQPWSPMLYQPLDLETVKVCPPPLHSVGCQCEDIPQMLCESSTISPRDCTPTHSSNPTVAFTDVGGAHLRRVESAYRDEVDKVSSWCSDKSLIQK